MLEVGAHTRVRDVCESLAARLQLVSWEGCSLFIKIVDKVLRAEGRHTCQSPGGGQGGGVPACAEGL